MNKKVSKFLEFNGYQIFFKLIADTYWIALKPVCSAIGLNYNRHHRNIHNNPVLKNTIKLQYFNAADNKNRKMLCLPEMQFYYWLLQLRSSKKELRMSQYQIYAIIYNELHNLKHFRGSINPKKTFNNNQE